MRNQPIFIIKHITSNVGRKTESVPCHGLYPKFNAPTYILNNSSLCVDLSFNCQPNLLIESGVHPSCHPSCYHRISYAKFNLDLVYSLSYERKICHHQKVNIDLIKRAINTFNWERPFPNIDVDKISIFLMR